VAVGPEAPALTDYSWSDVVVALTPEGVLLDECTTVETTVPGWWDEYIELKVKPEATEQVEALVRCLENGEVSSMSATMPDGSLLIWTYARVAACVRRSSYVLFIIRPVSGQA